MVLADCITKYGSVSEKNLICGTGSPPKTDNCLSLISAAADVKYRESIGFKVVLEGKVSSEERVASRSICFIEAKDNNNNIYASKQIFIETY